jgi:hypothetical protein
VRGYWANGWCGGACAPRARTPSSPRWPSSTSGWPGRWPHSAARWNGGGGAVRWPSLIRTLVAGGSQSVREGTLIGGLPYLAVGEGPPVVVTSPPSFTRCCRILGRNLENRQSVPPTPRRDQWSTLVAGGDSRDGKVSYPGRGAALWVLPRVQGAGRRVAEVGARQAPAGGWRMELEFEIGSLPSASPMSRPTASRSSDWRTPAPFVSVLNGARGAGEERP